MNSTHTQAAAPRQPRRALALDALRGYAIMTMILSSSIAFGTLPAWMYHAQTPPPTNALDTSVFGITWVDLVFPFFLFSMGAALPLSLGRRLAKGESARSLLGKSVARWVELTFFAIFMRHCSPDMLGYGEAWLNSLTPLVAVGLMSLMFLPNPFGLSRAGGIYVRCAAYAAALVMLLVQPYAGGRPFSLDDSDTIMLILANVSLTGSAVYLLTRGRPAARVAVLPFVVALFAAGATEGSWAKGLLDFSALPWLYRPRFQEYLLIVLPATLAGEWLSEWMRKTRGAGHSGNKAGAAVVGAGALGVVVCNVALLFSRSLVANLVATALLAALVGWALRRPLGATADFWRKLWRAGTYLLTLGLCFEAYEGGIRKEDVTVSFLLVTCGLAFFALLFFSVVCDHFQASAVSRPLGMVGRNPMLAYVSLPLVAYPLLSLPGWLDEVVVLGRVNAFAGVMQGVVLTAFCMGLTALCTLRGLFWKT